ncbi:conserved Plasmodium protein, unknown function [Plasmodium vivax]|uniref:Uncharacterized protein n=6 Tax=Plasmodium vivax TaxID=5855 RepID=A5K492_PLAVS|nr:hypothetical protein, conserved [Plasmodium vivax]KMZ80527.1 hypothetical protein PVIIG_04312 [Plasmodium vivax India VII]KMZ84166.1 hypothetical protein PVBG_02393 [Plasmodium vivax Brazil I]KMZ91915.1 hypothetical protein PVMG_04474 [Plasmodium vivax Mauritania I]KMZ99762.1 hypothetical protein PVNG_04052 [Plasmodium vivax North Korean]EDL45470.1 hypothetical protein, conserved [Plasmodium vivax]|eukprot:XP_001615197.1 hypothetical protein [Plasmodium vivax Sal-1]
MADSYENDEDVLQMIQQIKKITKESKRKFENEIDYLVEDTKTNLLTHVDDEKNCIKKEAEEKLNSYRENLIKYEKGINEKRRHYLKLKAELATVVNNYKKRMKDFNQETENFKQTYEREKKELEDLEDREWSELNTHCVELLSKTKSNICATKNETNKKLRKVLNSIM